MKQRYVKYSLAYVLRGSLKKMLNCFKAAEHRLKGEEQYKIRREIDFLKSREYAKKYGHLIK